MIAISWEERCVVQECRRLLLRGNTAEGWRVFDAADKDGVIQTSESYSVVGYTLAREENDYEGLVRMHANSWTKPDHSDDHEADFHRELSQLFIRRKQYSEAQRQLNFAAETRTPGTIDELVDRLAAAKLYVYDADAWTGCNLLRVTRHSLMEHPQLEIQHLQTIHDIDWWRAVGFSLTDDPQAQRAAWQVFSGLEFKGRKFRDSKLVKRRLPALVLTLAGPLRPHLARTMLKFS